eukprot:g12094.t1
MTEIAPPAPYWGVRNANVHFCEPAYAKCFYIAEFWNSLSNLYAIFFALFGMAYTASLARTRSRARGGGGGGPSRGADGESRDRDSISFQKVSDKGEPRRSNTEQRKSIVQFDTEELDSEKWGAQSAYLDEEWFVTHGYQSRTSRRRRGAAKKVLYPTLLGDAVSGDETTECATTASKKMTHSANSSTKMTSAKSSSEEHGALTCTTPTTSISFRPLRDDPSAYALTQLTWLCFLAMGVGSFLFHATQQFYAELLDEVFMSLTLLCFQATLLDYCPIYRGEYAKVAAYFYVPLLIFL